MRREHASTAETEEKRKLVTDRGRHLHKRKGSYLFRAGEPVGDIWILRSGKVKLCVGSPDGREMIIGIFAGGEAIWEGLLGRPVSERKPVSVLGGLSDDG